MRRSLRMAALVAAIAALTVCAVPSFAKGRAAHKDDASSEGLARLVQRINENAVRIRRLSFLFRAPGYPREDVQRSLLVLDNKGLLLRAETAARKLLDPIRKEPPPGQWAWWQLLRDTENGAHAARLMDDVDFREKSIAHRFKTLTRKEPEKAPASSAPSSPAEPSSLESRKAE